jgi:hypothetical protein
LLIKILIGLAVLIAVLVIIIMMQPPEFRVSRTTTIDAPAATLFEQVNTASKWEDWSPWAKVDPNAKFTYEGPASGIGAISKWSGNNDVGQGISTITESRPNELVKFKLEFIKPFAGVNTAEFTFTEQDRKTVVTWSMFGKNNFLSKAVGLIFNCEKMVGEQFDKGLANLKAIADAK